MAKSIHILISLIMFALLLTSVATGETIDEKSLFVDATLKITVVDGDGEPIENAKVTYTHTPITSREDDIALSDEGLTSADGYISFKLVQIVEDQMVTVTVSKTGYSGEATADVVFLTNSESETLILEQSGLGAMLDDTIGVLDNNVLLIILVSIAIIGVIVFKVKN